MKKDTPEFIQIEMTDYGCERRYEPTVDQGLPDVDVDVLTCNNGVMDLSGEVGVPKKLVEKKCPICGYVHQVLTHKCVVELGFFIPCVACGSRKWKLDKIHVDRHSPKDKPSYDDKVRYKFNIKLCCGKCSKIIGFFKEFFGRLKQVKRLKVLGQELEIERNADSNTKCNDEKSR